MDTISFRLKDFRTLSEAEFVPEFSVRNFDDLSSREQARARDNRTRYIRQFRLQPRNDEGEYLPRVEMYERADALVRSVWREIVVTLSLPKLLFANNLQEIAASDSERIFLKVAERLRNMGVIVNARTISQSPVSVAHFCKNIPLPHDLALRSIITDLSRTDMGKAYDTTDDTRRQQDKNNSKVVHLYSGTREWAFYDKIDDMRQPRGRRMDKQYSPYENDLFSIKNFGRLEVFRYEYRLNKAQTIRSEVNSLINRDPTQQVLVGDLFADGLWKEILARAWNKIIQRPENHLALLSSDSNLDLAQHIFREALKRDRSAHSQNKALWSYGLARLIKDIGAKAAKQELNKIWSSRDDRLADKIQAAEELTWYVPVSQGIAFVSERLEKFEKIDLNSLKNAV